MKGKVLTIRLSFADLQGCVDLQEALTGRKTTVTAAAQSAVEFLMASMRAKDQLPRYTDEEAELLLASSFGRLPGRTFDLGISLDDFDNGAPLTDDDFSPPPVISDDAGPGLAVSVSEARAEGEAAKPQKDLIEEAILEMKRQEDEDLRKKIIMED